MVFLYFEDWTIVLFMLDMKNFPHGDRIIKVYASPFDPRVHLNDPNLKVIEVDDSPLSGMTFEYEGRGTFSGEEIEARIAGFDSYTRRAIRGLFRFDNRDDLQFSQEGMHMKKGEEWLISHPLEDIDELVPKSPRAGVKAELIHLDIFEERSLRILGGILDMTEGSKQLLGMRTGLKLRQEIRAELTWAGQERKK